jgi:preprotein translocase subunit SecA
LLIYKLESFNLFRNLLYRMNSELASFLMHASLPQTQPQPIRQSPPRTEQTRMNISKAESMNLQQRVAAASGQTPPPAATAQKVEPMRVEKTVGRNEPCPCGSGKKFKSCHGLES